MSAEPVEFTTMRVPKDVNQAVNVLASIGGKSVQEWSNTRFRKWVMGLYRRELRRASKAALPKQGGD